MTKSVAGLLLTAAISVVADDSEPTCGYNFSEPVNPDMYDGSQTEMFSGKVSCTVAAFPIHLFFNFVIVFSGLAAMLLRLAPDEYKVYHPWCGRIYIISIMCSMLASLLIHNTGLPWAVVYCFIAALFCISVAWVSIVLYKQNAWNAALENVQSEIEGNSGLSGTTLNDKISKAKGDFWENKLPQQKWFSLKTLHGCFMFVAWFQFFGRFFYLLFLCDSFHHCYSILGGNFDFTCYTYPVYKPNVDNYIFCDFDEGACDGGYCPVSSTDPNEAILPWVTLGMGGWLFLIVLCPLIVAVLVAFGCTHPLFCRWFKSQIGIGERQPLIRRGD